MYFAYIMIYYVNFSQRLPNRAHNQSITDFMDLFLREVISGERKSNKGLPYAQGSIDAMKQAINTFKRFEKHLGTSIQFNDLCLDLYHTYISFLYSLHYSQNTVVKCTKNLKAIYLQAAEEGLHSGNFTFDKRLHIQRTDIDTIYLNREEIKRIESLNLSNLPAIFGITRDIFLIGVWTAQRFSDYSHIEPGDFIRRRIRGKEILAVQLIQKKTGVKVIMPCSRNLEAIFAKYNYTVPIISNQNMNRYIKEIAQLAGIDETIPITRTKGGVRTIQKVPKWKLVQSHTARRTGATLMYLSGMDIYDIMKITGHSTPTMLRKYIKADHLEILEKIVTNYSFFD